MKFSILITSFNQPEFLTEAVHSCFVQNYRDEFEVIVIDDCSECSYKIPVILSNVEDRPNIKLHFIRNVKNLGVAKSHNIAAYYASGEWLIRLDGDDMLMPNALEELSNFIDNETNRKIGFLYSDLEVIDPKYIRIYPDWVSGSIQDLQKIGHLQCYRRDRTLEIGGWDTTLAYSSDTDFIIRLIEHSVQIKHIPKVLYQNRLHSEQFTQTFQGNSNHWKNLIFNRALQKRPDLWLESRQNIIMQTSGSALWQSEVQFLNNFIQDYKNIKNGNGLDLGCSNKKKLNHSIGMDLDRREGKIPELVWDGSVELPFRDGTLDFIVGSHVIEHIKDPVNAIEGWFKKLKVGGIIFLIVPHKEYIPNIGSSDGDPTHVADYLPEDFGKIVLENLQTKCELLSFDKIKNNWSFDCFLRKTDLSL